MLFVAQPVSIMTVRKVKMIFLPGRYFVFMTLNILVKFAFAKANF
ncbi:hypothetical protein NMS_0511 [Nonlabens marinus S1-08]|uniref:Uncharacterized protein n=1 Tax=Nonlabens marinus S1-08 TaxID=1454201 RepID=W8VPJ1_9FLAO|nr:hypothetical protein NMS_0511 [Nonlabens marinus S1-08]